MTIYTQTKKKLIILIGLLVLISYYPPLYARELFFSDEAARSLAVVRVDADAETATIQSPTGETADLSVGDMIGKENFSIISIREFAIELESMPDGYGRKRKDCIPVMPIVMFEDM